jgi:predicted membrane-bound mannosyltransferase
LVTWWSALGWGAVAGALTARTLLGKNDSENQLLFALLGGVAGLLFWLFWKEGRT